MTQLSLSTLIDYLDTTTRTALEKATGMCLEYQCAEVEVYHWLYQLLSNTQQPLLNALTHQSIDANKWQQQLLNPIEKGRSRHEGTPTLSASIVELLQNTTTNTVMEFKTAKANTAIVIYTLAQYIQTHAITIPQYYRVLSLIDLKHFYAFIIEQLTAVKGTDTLNQDTQPSDILSRFTTDMIEQARTGKIDTVVGRNNEIRQLIDILTRRRQNNPLLVGEAGVGKTAIVEGFALRLAQNDVPPLLKNIRLLSIDLAALQAGTGVKGEFEQRLKDLVDAVHASQQPIILFIDEAHHLLGSGGDSGYSDAAHLLKPALARGELRTIGATTWAEYKKYIETDAALIRRFQLIKVEEPNEEQAIFMLQSLVDKLQSHHHVTILQSAVVAAVKLSKRYLQSRQLPDAAVSLLDTACARVQITQFSTPLGIEQVQQEIAELKSQIKQIEEEHIVHNNSGEVLDTLNNTLMSHQDKLTQFEKQWEEEKHYIHRLIELRKTLLDCNDKPKEQETLRMQYQQNLAALQDIQNEHALIQLEVVEQSIASVIADWTGIPVERLLKDDASESLSLEQQLTSHIFGQASAMHILSKKLYTARAQLQDPSKPMGVFLLVGASGVGKTETAYMLAERLYGGRQNLTVINMSEFKEAHKVSMLTGAPAGYVGYGEGGVLTEAVRKKPYSVILLDEIEKAHSSVQDVFYQVFDKGMLMDGQGRLIDFKNTLILMSSNAGATTIAQFSAQQQDLEQADQYDALVELLQNNLLSDFKPAFLGRVTLLPYFPLTDEVIVSIIKQKLAEILLRVKERYQVSVTYRDDLVQTISQACQNSLISARQIDKELESKLLPSLASYFLNAMLDEKNLIENKSLIIDKGYHVNENEGVD